jgi:hypothetical protein
MAAELPATTAWVVVDVEEFLITEQERALHRRQFQLDVDRARLAQRKAALDGRIEQLLTQEATEPV